MSRHLHEHDNHDLDALAGELGRRTGGGRLSDDARRRLFSAVTERAEPGPLAMLFLPIRRLALAAVLPALVLGVLLVGVAERDALEPAGAGQTLVSAEKVGNQVVFRIANGGQAHLVSRSVTPDDFSDPAHGVKVLGEYRDRLADGAGLVFYRID